MVNMNRNKLKTYAPEARRDFIQAMTDRAAFFGLTAKNIEPVVVRGDVAVIAGRDHPRAIADKRKKLEARIAGDGFEQTMEAMAYTWFNRLVAIRFMELHGYLDHGYRVLSHPDGKLTPEILEHVEHVELPGLKKDRAIDLKLEGSKESELYRLLLTAQCNALHKAMPFLFERIDDETELLLPDNLLHSDSLVRKLVNEIDEADWKEVEIIGWLYQFYIAEKKDEVIGKVVASADIPAATQLFTPNWIVKYLVQNTLGRQWLATYPNSALRTQMEYYIEPVEQTREVAGQIKAITPESLDPEALTMLDPACGSCHILVEGYDLFKAIYLERGYRLRDIPALILQKNLFGLEIDDRAAQLGAFALMMKARADDRRIFESEAKPNVISFQESRSLDAGAIVDVLNSPIKKRDVPRQYLFQEIDESEVPLLSKKTMENSGNFAKSDIASLLALFEDAKTFGSLIKVPAAISATLPELERRLDRALIHGDLVHASAQAVEPLIKQAKLLAMQFDVVVANPPYMGAKFFDSTLKQYLSKAFDEAKSDLYACFIQRNVAFSKTNGFVGMITIPNWMFLSSFRGVRRSLFESQTIDSFVHNGRGVFGSDFGSCSFAIRKQSLPTFKGSYRRLFERQGSVATNEELQNRFFNTKTFTASSLDFAKIPGETVAYWIGAGMLRAFAANEPLELLSPTKIGMRTGENGRFLRRWFEPSWRSIGVGFRDAAAAAESGKKWFPYNKGGEFRKWYGNNEYVVNWKNDGEEVKAETRRKYPQLGDNLAWKITNEPYYFRSSITWSFVSSSYFGVRASTEGFLFDVGGSSTFPLENYYFPITGFLCSNVCFEALKCLNPTLNFQVENIASLPIPAAFINPILSQVEAVAKSCVALSKIDWDSVETSWDFEVPPILAVAETSLMKAQMAVDLAVNDRFNKMKLLEEENNRLFIQAYQLQDELSPDVSEEQITLRRPDKEADVKQLLSYAVGCVMGRYSLDKAGLIYAFAGNQGFDLGEYKTFKADDDGIVPLLEKDHGFRDDAADRIVEFISVCWPQENLEENLAYVADGLGAPNSELPRETIRRYLSSGFYKHHLSTYKRRPIYWLFSSGRHRAFQCLVYLHRYHEGTLSRIRTEYVIPLQGRFSSRIEQIEGEKSQASSTSNRRKLQKEQDDLKKQQAELLIFEEKLKHFADQKISVDLDDGIKVNYGKFGDLLAEVKAITGGKDDE